MSKLPSSLREKAIKLRILGYSLQEIKNKCGISKSTASHWVRHVKLNREAQLRLSNRIKIGQMKTKESKRIKREQLLNSFRKEAQEEMKEIYENRCVIKLICAILFWCEGNKNTTTQIKFTNSDPEMIKYFLWLLRKGFRTDKSKFRALVHLHEYHDEAVQIDFWSKLTKIPKNQFYRSYRKPNTQKRIRKNYPGCICITYYDAQLAKGLWAYYKEAPKLF